MKLSTRIGIVAFTLGSCVLAAYIQLQESSTAAKVAPSELFDTIQTHVLALRSQHYQQAYLQVSSQRMERGGIEDFIASARGEFPTLRQAVRWEFGMVTETEDGTQVEVRFFLPGGDSLSANYTVVQENRSWKIDGVSFSTQTHARSLTGLRL